MQTLSGGKFEETMAEMRQLTSIKAQEPWENSISQVSAVFWLSSGFLAVVTVLRLLQGSTARVLAGKFGATENLFWIRFT